MTKWAAIAILCGILLMIGCVQTINPPIKESEAKIVEKDWVLDGYAAFSGKNRKQAEEFFLETYGLNGAKDIVKQIPERIPTFETDKQKMRGGSAQELGAIPKENYLQPDFYDTFESIGKKTWTRAPNELPSVVGIFSVPADQEATLEKDTNEFETYLLVGGGWGTTYFQGAAFTAAVLPEAPIRFEIDPPDALMGPTFPVLNEEWVQMIRIKGMIEGKLVPGKYVITVQARQPPFDKQEKWKKIHSRYVNVEPIFIDSQGLATLTLNVLE